MGLYLLGLVLALVVSYVAKWFIKIKEKSFFSFLNCLIIVLPLEQCGFTTMISKAKYLLNAGKIIMVISLILWALSSFGPGNTMQKVTQI